MGRDGTAENSHSRRAVWTAGFSSILSVLPAFLVGALAVFIRRDLGFSERELGIAISAYFGVTSLTSVLGGWIGETLGAARALRTATVISSTGAVMIAVLADSWWMLVAGLAVAAVAAAIIQPAANLLLARGIPSGRQGIAFGLKQSAGPAAALVAGFAVPVLGLTVGWRWAFGLVGVFAALTWPFTRSDGPVARRPRRSRRSGDLDMGMLVLLAVSVVPATAAAMAMSAFFVESAVEFGHSTASAGLWLTVGGVSAIVLRVLTGLWADRVPSGRLLMVSWMLSLGAIGFALMAVSGSPWLLLAGTLLAFGAGWGWPGLYHFGIVRLNPGAPAEATGVVAAAMSAGGMMGPVAFGLLVETFSYSTAWLTFAVVLASGSVLLRYTVRTLRRSIGFSPSVAAQTPGEAAPDTV